MAPSDWFYAKDNRQLGPVSSSELKRLAESGQLTADDLVWREGLAEWMPADKVKGLFDAPVQEPSQVKPPPTQTSPDTPSSRFAISPALPPSDRPGKHPFDMLIKLVRRNFPPRFIDASSKIFSAVGYYGLYVGMALLLVFVIALGATVDALPVALAAGAVGILVLVVLQYACGKLLSSLEILNRSTSGRMSSTALPDCFALLSMCVGLAVLVVLVIIALPLGNISIILLAIGIFVLCEYAAILSLSLDTLNIKIETDVSAGQEAVGILAYLAKLIPRLVPIAFGVGVALGICDLIIDGVALASGSGVETIAIIGPVKAVATSARVLFISAGLPIVAYFLFLLAYLFVDVLHSILELPRLLKKNDNEPSQTQ